MEVINMNVKVAKEIKAEKGITKEVKLYIEDNGNKEFETLGDLLEEINYWIKWADEHGYKEDLLNRPVTMSLTDIEGQNVEGRMCLAIGELIDGTFLLTGNIENISFVNE